MSVTQFTPGQRFARLVVIEKSASRRYYWVFRCDCGTIHEAYGHNVLKGKTKSCGCGRIKHRLWSIPEYQVWTHMRYRCLNPSCRQYKNYGGRGIRICNRWSSFSFFLEDMGRRPSDSHSLGRIDNEGDYSSTNCRWEIMRQQQNNKRRNVNLTIDGQTLTIAEWARVFQIKPHSAYTRIRKGWAPQDAVSIPVKRARRFHYHGRLRTIKELAVIAGIKRTTMKERLLHYKWSISKAMTIAVK